MQALYGFISSKKIEIVFALGVSVLAYMGAQYMHGSQQDLISEYYSKIENQEVLREDVIVTKEDLSAILACAKKFAYDKNKVEECNRNFYDAYTMVHGPADAFAHLARLQKEHKNLLPSCHYISHGIGNAVLRRSGKDPYKAFSIMQTGNLFKNVVTCGNGYFHGVIEEVAKDTTDKDELVTLLSGICSSAKIKNKGNCFHGIGHAATIQTEYNIADMQYICDRISPNPVEVFGCHTGGYMEYAQIYPRTVSAEAGEMKFDLCDSLEKKYQPACYLELSSAYESFSTEPRNYTRNVGFCKQIADDLNRMACVKLFAIRAVRISHYHDIYAMCSNTSTKYEQVMCTAVIADKMGGSRDSTRRTRAYHESIDGVCKTLNPLYAGYCKHLVYIDFSQLFYTSAADFDFPPILELLKKRALLL